MKPTVNRIVNFVVILLMMTGAAINVNRSLLGKDLSESQDETSTPDSITNFIVAPDGYITVNTTGLTDKTGYSGTTPLEIKISPDGVIEEIVTLPNTETPGFFKRASTLLDSIKGREITTALADKVDAVSGATMSSDALLENVRAAQTLYSKEMKRIPMGDSPAGTTPWKLWVALAVTLAACILPLFIHNKKYHVLQLCLNVGVLGFWCGNFLSYGLMVNWLSYGLPRTAMLIPALMLTAAFIYPIFGKPKYYCTHICPLGSAQQLAGLCCSRKIKMPLGLTTVLEWFRRILWAVLMFCLWMPVMTGWMDYELFSAFMVESTSWVILTCGAAVVILSFFINRPYCRFICPTGTLFDINH